MPQFHIDALKPNLECEVEQQSVGMMT